MSIYFIQRGGMLYRIAKTGQHEYEATFTSKVVKPSIADQVQIYIGSLVKSRSKFSSAFYAFHHLMGATSHRHSHEHLCTITYAWSYN
jgi:hypothetical protein